MKRGVLMRIASNRLTIKGQVTIPKEVRTHLHLKEGDFVAFTINEDKKVFIEREQPHALCPLCDRGFVFTVQSQRHIKCTLCQGTEHYRDRLLQDWLKTALDMAIALEIQCSITTDERGYQVSYYTDFCNENQSEFIKECESFMQRQLRFHQFEGLNY